MLEIWLWLKFRCKEHKAAFSRRKTHVLTFYITLRLGRVSSCGRGWVYLQFVRVCPHTNMSVLGLLRTPPPSWKALNQCDTLVNSPASSQAKPMCLGKSGWGRDSWRRRQRYGSSRPAEGTWTLWEGRLFVMGMSWESPKPRAKCEICIFLFHFTPFLRDLCVDAASKALGSSPAELADLLLN